MPRYEEKTSGWILAALILVVAFLAIYSPWQLSDRELYWQEGYFAAMAMEMDYFIPLTFAHGMVIQDSFPLFPWIAAIIHNEFGVSMEMTLRFISIVALGVIAIVVWFAARSAGGTQAAAVAAAMMISTNVVIEKSIEGYPNTLMLLALTGAWFSWFMLGAGRSNWSGAWAASLFFAALAFYTFGLSALIYFFFPMIFMRRPLTIWPKMNKYGFYIGVTVLLGFIMLWAVPHIIFANTFPFKSLDFEPDSISVYLEHLITFPFDVAVRLMPWTLLAWAPFCVEYFPLDKTPIFSRYLRTIVISTFFLLWISPFTEPRDIMMLIPPLAVMTGSNYWLVIRRYGDKFLLLLKLLSFPVFIVGGIIIIFYLLPADWWDSIFSLQKGIWFRNYLKYTTIGMILGTVAVAGGITLIQARIRPYIWAYILIIVCAVMFFFWSLIHPYKAQSQIKKSLGMELRAALSAEGVTEKDVIYIGPNLGLYGECFYMGGKIITMNSVEEIPADQKVVYFISTEFPQVPERRWRNLLSNQKTYKDKRICLWQGIKLEKKKTVK